MFIALNYKNPPGRLLRGQWTQSLAGPLGYQNWGGFKDQLTLSHDVLNIPIKNLSLIRQNRKYCFPCDNSVIRINKNFCGSRCFGSSKVVKDNFVFGLREPLSVIDDKIPMEDHILSLEAKRKTDRRCEFWLEFENGVKMFAEMLDPVPAETSLIPPLDG